MYFFFNCCNIYRSIRTNGNRTAKYRYVGATVSRNDLLSRWRMQVGVRIVF